MKKSIALLLLFICTFSFVGCVAAEHETDNTNTNQESIADNKDNISTKATEDIDETPGGTRFIINIRDRAEEEHLDCAEAEEQFFEDETTEYYFNVIKSHYIIVTYDNGDSEDIVTALNTGRATVADLDKFGIEYHTESKQANSNLPL